jgi:RNA polymerase sigma-70 factor (ECF subfamily)
VLHRKQLRGAIFRAIGRLPERQAEAFVMRELSGLETDEICRALGVTANHAWVLLHRARAGLRAALARDGFSCA